jgi:hypothetical protein
MLPASCPIRLASEGREIFPNGLESLFFEDSFESAHQKNMQMLLAKGMT